MKERTGRAPCAQLFARSQTESQHHRVITGSRFAAEVIKAIIIICSEYANSLYAVTV